jgi:hypothetical protein
VASSRRNRYNGIDIFSVAVDASSGANSAPNDSFADAAPFVSRAN